MNKRSGRVAVAIFRTFCSSANEKGSPKYGYSIPYMKQLVETIWPSEDKSNIQSASKDLPPSNFTRSVVVERSLSIVNHLHVAKTPQEQLIAAKSFEEHLMKHPQAISLRQVSNSIVKLKEWSKYSHDFSVVEQASRCLALIAYVRPVTGRGIRLLSIDGGGSRGMIALETLQALESLCFGYRIHELFDYIIGVSTGAVIAALLGGLRLNVRECKEVYEYAPKKLFKQSRIGGSLGLLWSHSYYDTEKWKAVLRQSMGEKSLLDTVERKDHMKIAMVSCISGQMELVPFVFRNYSHALDKPSSYQGSCNFKLWEAAQASAAAPGYFQQCILGDHVHQDGGIVANNPTAIGVHECLRLWPEARFQCVLSLGNGQHISVKKSRGPTEPLSLSDRITKIIETTTETHMVHTSMTDLLPDGSYYRLNPYVRHVYSMDESDPIRMKMMQSEAAEYVKNNKGKLESVAKRLMEQNLLTLIKQQFSFENFKI